MPWLCKYFMPMATSSAHLRGQNEEPISRRDPRATDAPPPPPPRIPDAAALLLLLSCAELALDWAKELVPSTDGASHGALPLPFVLPPHRDDERRAFIKARFSFRKWVNKSPRVPCAITIAMHGGSMTTP